MFKRVVILSIFINLFMFSFKIYAENNKILYLGDNKRVMQVLSHFYEVDLEDKNLNYKYVCIGNEKYSNFIKKYNEAIFIILDSSNISKNEKIQSVNTLTYKGKKHMVSLRTASRLKGNSPLGVISNGTEETDFIYKKDNYYYVNSTLQDKVELYVFIDALHDILGVTHKEKPSAYYINDKAIIKIGETIENFNLPIRVKNSGKNILSYELRLSENSSLERNKVALTLEELSIIRDFSVAIDSGDENYKSLIELLKAKGLKIKEAKEDNLYLKHGENFQNYKKVKVSIFKNLKYDEIFIDLLMISCGVLIVVIIINYRKNIINLFKR